MNLNCRSDALQQIVLVMGSRRVYKGKTSVSLTQDRTSQHFALIVRRYSHELIPDGYAELTRISKLPRLIPWPPKSRDLSTPTNAPWGGVSVGPSEEAKLVMEIFQKEFIMIRDKNHIKSFDQHHWSVCVYWYQFWHYPCCQYALHRFKDKLENSIMLRETQSSSRIGIRYKCWMG